MQVYMKNFLPGIFVAICNQPISGGLYAVIPGDIFSGKKKLAYQNSILFLYIRYSGNVTLWYYEHMKRSLRLKVFERYYPGALE
jgi:hypothetical protein